MCTVVILRRPDHAWPLILAANRDEMGNRPWRPPAAHWPDRPDVIAGIDLLAQGTWLGMNRYGVVAGVLNRRHSLGPAPDARSRGELPLEALDHASAADAAGALARLEPASYRSFNMVIADAEAAFWLSSRRGEDGAAPDEAVRVAPISAGLSMLTASDLNDSRVSARIRHYLPRFRAVPPPDPETSEWTSWQSLLASRESSDSGPEGAMTIVTDSAFGTVSSSILALPRRFEGKMPIWLFCPGRPDKTPFAAVPLWAGKRKPEPPLSCEGNLL